MVATYRSRHSALTPTSGLAHAAPCMAGQPIRDGQGGIPRALSLYCRFHAKEERIGEEFAETFSSFCSGWLTPWKKNSTWQVTMKYALVSRVWLSACRAYDAWTTPHKPELGGGEERSGHEDPRTGFASLQARENFLQMSSRSFACCGEEKT